MVGRNKDRNSLERLDRVGREITRASAANETEAADAATSAFFYTRVRARIAAEIERREEGERWLALLGVVWRAVPAMGLAAVFALVMFLSSSFYAWRTPANFADEALLGERDAGIERVVFTDARAVSDDEVLSTIVSYEGEASR